MYWNILKMHVPINVKSPNNISEWQKGFNSAFKGLIFFHDHALIIILIIITAVFYTIIRIIQNKQTRRFILEGQIIESLRTIAPSIILVFIAIPSLRLLYLIDEIHSPVITLKTVGHQ